MKSQSLFSRRILFFILILALTSQACAISLIEWPTFPTSTPSTPSLPTGPTATALPRAEVTFTVRLPDGTSVAVPSGFDPEELFTLLLVVREALS